MLDVAANWHSASTSRPGSTPTAQRMPNKIRDFNSLANKLALVVNNRLNTYWNLKEILPIRIKKKWWYFLSQAKHFSPTNVLTCGTSITGDASYSLRKVNKSERSRATYQCLLFCSSHPVAQTVVLQVMLSLICCPLVSHVFAFLSLFQECFFFKRKE